MTEAIYFRKCYIQESRIINIEEDDNMELPENIEKYYYSAPIFMSDYTVFYIILDYDINQDIIDKYNDVKQSKSGIILSIDILELLSNKLFGYKNIDDIEHFGSDSKQRNLIIKHIIDNKCMYARCDIYYDPQLISIISPNNEFDYEYQDLQIAIQKHYTDKTIYRGMFYWIKTDYLELEEIYE